MAAKPGRFSCFPLIYIISNPSLYLLFERIFYLTACLFLRGTHKRKLRDAYVKIFLSKQLKADGAGAAA